MGARALRRLRTGRKAQRKHAALNAFISLIESNPRRSTRKLEGDWNHGTPCDLKAPSEPPEHAPLLAVKDNITTRNFPTTCASGMLRNHRSPYDASVIRQMSAEYSVNGKTNMDEFGMGSHSINSFFGPVKIPRNSVKNDGLESEVAIDEYSAGGSSGGSAVAVRTNQTPVALGTDTGGSVRLPAAYVGVVGFKPSYGLISRFGVVPYANSLDTVGILGRTVREVRNTFRAATNHDPQDPTSLPRRLNNRGIDTQESLAKDRVTYLKGLTIGVPLEYNIKELHPTVHAAWNTVIQLLQEKGCTVVPISLPTTKHALSAYYVIAAAEAMSNLAKYDGVRYGHRGDTSDGAGDVLYSNTRGQGFGDEVKRRILLGSYTLSSEAIDNYFLKAQKVRRLVQRDFDRVFTFPNPLRSPEQFDLSEMEDSITLKNKLGPAQVDFIISPTAPTPPPTIKDLENQSPVDAYMNDVFTVPASLAGIPAISIPVDISKEYQQLSLGKRLMTLTQGFSDNSSVAGIQIIGQCLDDARLLTFARALEKLLLLDRSSLHQTESHGSASEYAIENYKRIRSEVRVMRTHMDPTRRLATEVPLPRYCPTDAKERVEKAKETRHPRKETPLVRYHHFERRDPDNKDTENDDPSPFRSS